MPAQHQHINSVVGSVLTHWCWHEGQSSAVQFIFTVEAEGKSLKILVWIPVSYSLFVQERQNQRMCQQGSPKVARSSHPQSPLFLHVFVSFPLHYPGNRFIQSLASELLSG